MKTLRTLLAAGALLAAYSPVFGSVEAPAQSRAEGWLTRYYENPRPDDLLVSVHRLSADGFFERAGHTAMAIGFFAEVFAQHPHRVGPWLGQTATLPAAHRRILAAAAWQAGHPRGLALMREFNSTDEASSRMQVNELLRRGPAPVAGTPVVSESSLRLQWGAFLATGRDEHVVAMLQALGKNERDLTLAVRYAIAENAVSHRRVLEICRAQLDKQPESVRSELRAALKEAAIQPRI
ncbi:MAG: hypothetical protein Q8N18_13800 [Opitutaceae bacterium]|nr:hypothetical protein [Opitutaceae bacterium]